MPLYPYYFTDLNKIELRETNYLTHIYKVGTDYL